MRDGVLAGDDSPVEEAGRDVVREIGVNGWDYVYVAWDAGDGTKEVNRALETACEQSGTGQEEIADGC